MPKDRKQYQPMDILINSIGQDVLTASGDAVGDFNPEWLKDQEEKSES